MLFGCPKSCGLCDQNGKLCADFFMHKCPNFKKEKGISYELIFIEAIDYMLMCASSFCVVVVILGRYRVFGSLDEETLYGYM